MQGVRSALVFVLSLCILMHGALSVQADDQQPSPPPNEAFQAESARLAGPRELLRIFGMDEAFFNSFADDQPLNADEREKLLKLIYRVREFDLADIDRWTQRDVGLSEVALHPDNYRGELLSARGTITRVVCEELPPKLRDRFQLERGFRCEFTADDGTLAIVYTPVVPQAWQWNEPIQEPGGMQGLFVKRLLTQQGESTDKPRLLFIAPRMAWHPPTLLGKLGMDVGWFDEVRDRRGLIAGEKDSPHRGRERECFYQLLAAVGRAKPGALDRAAAEELARLRKVLPARLKKTDPESKQYLLLENQLALAEQNRSNVAPLFNEPQSQRGRIVVLEGTARRAVEIRVEDPDIVSRFNLHRYYEIEVFTRDSQNNPIVFCVLSLPAGMPLGESIYEGVRISGVFLKSWSYRSQQPGGGDDQAVVKQQLAPLLIGQQVQWLGNMPLRNQQLPGAVAIGFFVLALFGVLWGLWKLTRNDPSIYKTIATPLEPARRGSVPANPTTSDTPPDFSHLK